MTNELTMEQVKNLLENATNPDSWYWQPGWGLQCHFPDGLGLLVPDEQKSGDMLLMEAAPRLARQLLAALTAQAEEVERLRDALESISAGASIAQQMGGANNFTKTMGRAADQALKGANDEP